MANASEPLLAQEALEPVAIIGMACRWPGESGTSTDIETPSALWEFLEAKKDAYSDFPAHRIKLDSWYHPDTKRPGSFYTRGGCFLKSDPREFDPSFFGINQQETTSIDPAQRKFLEVVYEAFESAGVPLDKLSGSKTGCFVGNFNYDHQLMQYRDTEYPEPYGISGGGIALLSNRVNYVFNLHGPSLTLDTACSSSMYALHLACTAIHSGECSAAIVGGSNLILTPECQIFSSALGAVSKSSRCHTFDEAADGYARADGLGALYIKTLKQAITDKDPIRAIVRGTAINANGRTGGITHPDPSGQEEAIRRAYERAGGIDPAYTAYFECHGTGTPVGDPIEVEAVARVFAEGRTAENPLLIGSIKTNLGHCEPASGIAGIMKTVLALEHDAIPPIKGLRKLNPNVDLRGGRLSIVQKITPWPVGHVRRASVNSFGYGGANAHTILEAIDQLAPGCGGVRAKVDTDRLTNGRLNGHLNGSLNGITNGFTNGVTHEYSDGDRDEYPGKNCQYRRQFLLLISAHNEKTLKSNVDALEMHYDKYDLRDLAYTLGCRRSSFAIRSFVVAKEGNLSELLDSSKIVVQKAIASHSPVIGFVFTGQGAQWPQMGVKLMDSFPVYLKSIRHMDYILGSLKNSPSWTIEDSLYAESKTTEVYRAEMSQPLVTAVQIALVDLLVSWGITPSVTVGHSSGEIAAAYASGRMTAAESIIVAYARGRAMCRNMKKGSMLAVGVGAKKITPFLDSNSSVTIACYNSPESVTMSGDADDILRLQKTLEAKGIFARVMQTNGNAYHSAHMKALGETYKEDFNRMLFDLASKVGEVELPLVDFVSSVYGSFYTRRSIDTLHWRANLEEPVFFHQAVTKIVTTIPVDLFVEIGPHAALQGPIRQIAKSTPDVKFPEYVPTLIRGKDGVESVLRTAGALWARGYKVDFESVNTVSVFDRETNSLLEKQVGNVIVDLPKYQWQYGELNYFENRWTREWRLRTHPRHDLLGSRQPGGNQNEPTWRNILTQKGLPWLQDHRIGPDTVFPTTAYLCMIIEAMTQTIEINGIDISKITNFEMEQIQLKAALIVPTDSHGIEVLVSLRPTDLDDANHYDSLYDFSITSVTSSSNYDSFTEHAHGKIGFVLGSSAGEPPKARPVSNNGKPISSSRWYDAFASVGLNYGPAFQRLANIKVLGDKESAESHINMLSTESTMSDESRYVIHPTAIDSALQLAILAAHRGRVGECKTSFMPVYLDRVNIQMSTGEKWTQYSAVAEASSANANGLTADVSLVNANDLRIFTASNVVFIATDQRTMPTSEENMAPYTKLVWQPKLDILTNGTLKKMYPPMFVNVKDGELPLLEQLALHQIIQFHKQYPALFAQGSEISFLKRYMDWMTQKVELAKQNEILNGAKIWHYSIQERQQEMEKLSASLMELHGPETRLMCHMYKSLPAIFRGEMSGIQAAVQDHLLDDTYKYMTLYHRGNSALKELVILLSHQNPSLKILEVGGGTASATSEVVPALRADTLYRGYDSYTFTDITSSFLAGAQDKFKDYKGMKYTTFDMQIDPSEQGFDSDYDLVIASNVVHATTDIQNTLSNIRRLLRPGGKLVLFEIVQPRLSWVMILGTFSDFWHGDKDLKFPRTEGPFLTHDTWKNVLPQAGFSGIDILLDHFTEHKEAAVIMSSAVDSTSLSRNPLLASALSVVHRGSPSNFVLGFVDFLHSIGFHVDLVPLTSQQALPSSRVIFLVEVDEPLFVTITPEEWSGFKHLVLTAGSALWVTRGSLLDCKNAEYALISGIACAIHTETRSSRFLIVDLDEGASTAPEQSFENLVQLEARAANYTPGDDFEFRCKEGVVYVSRIENDDTLNDVARTKLATHSANRKVPLTEVSKLPVKLVTDKPGAWNTAHFEEDLSFPKMLDKDGIEVQIKAAGIDKGSEMITGGQPSNFVDGGFLGIVAKVGSNVTHLKPGDQAFGISFSRFSNIVQERASFFQSIGGKNESELATIPLAFSVAIYGLEDLARLGKNDTILIPSASNSITLAACQIASLSGAKIYTTVTSEAERKVLLSIQPNIQDDHIFVSSPKNTPEKILQHLGDGGVDVIFTSGKSAAVKQYWKCIAAFGRFVAVETPDFLDNSKLGIKEFLQKNITISSVNMKPLAETRPEIIVRLLERTKDLYVQGKIKPLPVQDFHASNVDEGLANDEEGEKIGQLIINFQPTQDAVAFRGSPFNLCFSSNASYILVGCLGGLGRSLASWMVTRGARSLAFLSRSGVSIRETREFASGLVAQGVKVQIVQGDVACAKDVEKIVRGCIRPIKGIVQAPLTLHDAFFSEMTLDKFNATIQPRVHGTINLHNAVRHLHLDFFVMLSSWTTIVGSASQSNYMAANSFMDAFARHRRSLGMPATSLALGQILDVGIVSYIPQYQENLLKMGLYGNTEAEFLQYCEAAMLESAATAPSEDPTFSKGHVLAGLEPTGLRENAKRYPIKDMPWYADPRFSRLVAAVERLASGDGDPDVAVAADDNEADALIDRVRKRVARFLYVATEDIDVARPISQYGIDSLVAAEVRNWLFQAFGVTVSSLNLLHPTMSVEKLAGEVEKGGRGRSEEGT